MVLPRAGKMHRSKGKLSGVLSKGFKPDKWSVQIVSARRFLLLPSPLVSAGCEIERLLLLLFLFLWRLSKIALKMAMARIKLLRNKKEVQVCQMRREVAQLLDGNQDQTARIRVRLDSPHPPPCSCHPSTTSTVRPIDDVIVWTNGVLDYGNKVHSRRFYSNIGEVAIIWRA